MTSEPSLFIKRIRHLSLALIISGVINIGVLSLLLYWVLRERPPTPYCELKPASSEQQQIPLADNRGCAEILTSLSQLSLSQLVNRLSHAQLIENGYAERDLALACLMTFHHFDIQRALPRNAQPQQKRVLIWKPKGQEANIPLVVYPDLTQEQFDAIIQFAKTERWPLTPEGLFLKLQEQKEKGAFEQHLIESFVLTPEFWTVELLFNRSGQQVNKQEILTLILEGCWPLIKQFVDQQRQLHDASDARRQKFLLDYLKAGAPSATSLLLKTEWDFAVKKLDDLQVISILKIMPFDLPEGISFAKEMLLSPRSTNVWRQASQWLYKQAGEPMPKTWNHQMVLARFIPEKASLEFVSKSLAQSTPVSSSLPLTPSKSLPPSSIKETGSLSKKTMPLLKPTYKQQTSKILVQSTPSQPKQLSTVNQPLIYIVQPGDTLWKIARRYGLKVEEIKKFNQLKSDTLKKGMVLKIPRQIEKVSL